VDKPNLSLSAQATMDADKENADGNTEDVANKDTSSEENEETEGSPNIIFFFYIFFTP